MMQRKRVIKVPRNCEFCNEKTEPDFKSVVPLMKYMSDRGRIVGRDRTGVCAKHQRKMTREIKRARHLGLLPFVSGI